MMAFMPVTDAELARARNDPAFRQKLLEHGLEVLLAGLQRARNAKLGGNSASPKLIREGVELAVKLAELIQAPGPRPRGRS